MGKLNLSTLNCIVSHTDTRSFISNWCLCSGNSYSDCVAGSTIDELIQFMWGRQMYCQDISIQSSYIINWLIENEFYYVDNLSNFHEKYDKVKTPNKAPKTFCVLRSPKGTIYFVGATNYGRYFEIRNSRSLLLNDLAIVAKDWGIDDIVEDNTKQCYNRQSTDIEYSNMIDYSIALYRVIVDIREGGKMLTVGRNAMLDWIRRDKAMATMLNYKLPQEVDTDIRHAYRGGLLYNDEDTLGVELGHGYILDMNSIYGYVMKQFKLPYGQETHISDEVFKFGFSFCQYKVSATIKPDGIPCISDKSGLASMSDEGLKVLSELCIWLSDFDLRMLKEHYDITKLEFLQGYSFEQDKGFFDNFIDHWYDKKKHSTGADRVIAKGNMTTLYGGLGKKNYSTVVPVIIDNNLRWRQKRDKDNKIIKVIPKFRYIPVAAAITSIARWVISHIARECSIYGYMCAIDTDAIHIICDDIPSCIKEGTDLGVFKVEAEFKSIKHLGPKQYGYIDMNDNIVYKLSGLPKSKHKDIPWDCFYKSYRIDKGRPYTKELSGGYIRCYEEYIL